MKSNISPYLFVLVLFSGIFSCKKNKSHAPNPGLFFSEDLPADFLKFHMRFHQDSLYQLEHIQFPLEGIPNMAADVDPDSLSMFKWKKENWIMHKPFNYSEAYLREYVLYSDALISEMIIEKQSGFGMERRFSKIRDDWYLIYFAGMNQITQ